nr:hypothetical protein [Chelativorans sp. YIM 93263]
MGSKKETSDNKDERQKRLSAELRANLAKRKAQARSRRAGAADNRTEGIPSLKRENQD